MQENEYQRTARNCFKCLPDAMLCSEVKPRLIAYSRAEVISMTAFSGTPTSGMFGGDLVMEHRKSENANQFESYKRMHHKTDYLLLDDDGCIGPQEKGCQTEHYNVA